MSPRPLRILLVEDDPRDAELVRAALKRAALDHETRRVQTEADLRRELADFQPDVVLSDFSMPNFSGAAALKLLRESGADVPLIFVSGTIGEDVAVEAMKEGANDYVMKGNLTRLVPAILRELREAQSRKARKEAEAGLLRAGEELRRFRLAMDYSADMVLLIDRATMRFIDVNTAACTLLGYSREEMLAMGPQDVLPVSRAELERSYDEMIRNPSAASGMNSYYRCRDGSDLPFESTRCVLKSSDAWVIVAISRDIRERIAAERALKERELRFRQTFEMAGSGIAHVAPDGRFLRVNRKLCEMLGYSEAELLQRTVKQISHPADRDVTDERVAQMRAGRLESAAFEKRYLRKNGGVVWVSLTVAVLREGAGGEGYSVAVFDDITERKAAQERIEHLTRVHAVLSGINGAIVRIQDRRQLFEEVCRVAVRAGQFPMVWIGVLDRAQQRVLPMAGNELAKTFLASARPRLSVAEDSVSPAALAVRDRRPFVSNDIAHDPLIGLKSEHGRLGIRSLAMLPLLVSSEPVGVLALHAAEVGFFDSEEMKLLQELAGDIAFALDHIDKSERVEYLAYYDALTGIANRSLFHERLGQNLALAGEAGSAFALVLLDIERFKSINDALGRQVGDGLLKKIVARITGKTDPNRLARIAADQFAVMVPDVPSVDTLIRRHESRMNEVFGSPFEVDGNELRISVKSGIALFPGDGGTAETLFKNAEAALQKAKSSSERYLFYTQEMTERVTEKLALENKLRLALENEEFVLHYQPKVDVEARRVVGLEALIRWQSPELGLVPPMSFIPLLEETGLILEVGSWALRRAARDHREWTRAGLKPPRIAVNVSPIQLRQRDFVANVERAIMEGVAPTGIDLEITESLIMEDIEANIGKLRDVRALGVSIAVDDFGTGYSSLSYLAKLPVETLKIDRSFIITMMKDANTMTLVQTIVSLGHSLGLKVVAEGVDAEEQAGALKRLRCDQMQGYLFSKPLPLDAAEALLRKPR